MVDQTILRLHTCIVGLEPSCRGPYIWAKSPVTPEIFAFSACGIVYADDDIMAFLPRAPQLCRKMPKCTGPCCILR